MQLTNNKRVRTCVSPVRADSRKRGKGMNSNHQGDVIDITINLVRERKYNFTYTILSTLCTSGETKKQGNREKTRETGKTPEKQGKHQGNRENTRERGKKPGKQGNRENTRETGEKAGKQGENQGNREKTREYSFIIHFLIQ